MLLFEHKLSMLNIWYWPLSESSSKIYLVTYQIMSYFLYFLFKFNVLLLLNLRNTWNDKWARYENQTQFWKQYTEQILDSLFWISPKSSRFRHREALSFVIASSSTLKNVNIQRERSLLQSKQTQFQGSLQHCLDSSRFSWIKKVKFFWRSASGLHVVDISRKPQKSSKTSSGKFWQWVIMENPNSFQWWKTPFCHSRPLK